MEGDIQFAAQICFARLLFNVAEGYDVYGEAQQSEVGGQHCIHLC